MKINRQIIERIIFRQYKVIPRFTQDSPIYPDVWMTYFEHIDNLHDYKLDLILTPHRKSNAAELFKAMSEQLNSLTPNNPEFRDWRMASSGESVVAKLNFYHLIYIVVLLSGWWQKPKDLDKGKENNDWLKLLVGAFLYAYRYGQYHKGDSVEQLEMQEEEMFKLFIREFEAHFGYLTEYPKSDHTLLYSVSRNRPATITIQQSIGSTKADASRRLFDIDGSEIAWAVLDTGIDARNKAFRKKDPQTGKPCLEAFGANPGINYTRIVETYDFTRFRDILATIHESHNLKNIASQDKIPMVNGYEHERKLSQVEVEEYVQEISRALLKGRSLDWTLIAPLLLIPHTVADYKPPEHPHGSHVAGIIGAYDTCDPLADPLVGMCPGIDLYDIRVLNKNGEGEEFNILAAIHFIRWLNNHNDGFKIHGANLSFSMTHEVASYACGQTPVCEACERLVAEGTVLVAAAGNLGQTMYTSSAGLSTSGFRTVNITDPGNANSVITVGSTHRNRPHTYGVSYFSSRGPTGDGRVKPDLVAPGEKITSCVIGDGTDKMDGTSMAAPHVSGAAALLLAKHRELIGRPRRVKEILCNTATDLGREKYFQGFGLVDVLRAIQSV